MTRTPDQRLEREEAIGRSVAEWFGATPDSAIPKKVKARVWARCGGRCTKTGKKLRAGDNPQYDHIKPLKDGGIHCESNLQLLSGEAHKEKTGEEATRRAKENRIHAKHFGYAPKPTAKIKSRPFPKRWSQSQ